MENEADTCRKFVLPKLYLAGWSDEQIREQWRFTDGRVIVRGNTETVTNIVGFVTNFLVDLPSFATSKLTRVMDQTIVKNCGGSLLIRLTQTLRNCEVNYDSQIAGGLSQLISWH